WATLPQVLYFAGLEHTSPTIACALLNLSPAITFMLAIPLRMETIAIKTNQGKAKIIGTIICIGGAMIMTFYKGSLINIGTSDIHWRYAVKVLGNKSADESSSFLGMMLVFLATIMCGMASIQCLLIGVLMEGCSVEAWSLASPIRVGTCLYSINRTNYRSKFLAAFSSALAFAAVISWCISKRGPLYALIFNPVAMIVVAFLGWLIIDEKIHVVSIRIYLVVNAVGAVLTVIGLYAVLWGKHQELKNQLTAKSSCLETGSKFDGDKDVEMMGDGHDKRCSELEQVKWWNPSYEK
ncbi:hypothetical protein MKW94_023894, partial [Papaver nudicaule]|nr:hypothetical protein [Papaver nudicaule]